MNKKHTKLLIMLVVTLLLTTGCTKLLKDKDGNNVQNIETGQNLPKNILCQPEDENTIKEYNRVMNETYDSLKEQLESGSITQEEYEKRFAEVLDISKLPKCSEFSVTSGTYDGLWDTFFIKPLVWVLIQLGIVFGNYGISIITVTLIIRMITYSFTKKTAMQSEKIAEAKPELNKIEKKYAGKEDQESLLKKNQEIMMVYNKYGIKPLSGCVFAFLQIPLFFAFYESLNRLPAIFEGTFLTLQMGKTPMTALSNSEFIYIIFPILVILASYYSFKLNKTTTGDSVQEAQMNMMSNMSVAMISIASMSLSLSISLYWITNSTFTIIQNLLVKRRKNNAK